MKESSVILLLTSLLPTITSLSCYSCSTFEVDPAVTTLDSQALRSNVVTRQTFQLISDSLQTDCESDGVSKVCPGESCIASHIRLESIEDDDGRMTLGTISLYECGAEWLEKDQKFCRSAENGISDPTLEAECYMSTCRDGDLCNIPNVLLKPLTTFSSNTVKPTEASSDMTNGETDRAETEDSTQDNGDNDIVIKEGEGENEEESRDGEIEDEGESGSDSEMEIKETDNENETVVEESGTGDESGAVEDQEESVNQPTDGTSSTELDEENGNINETAEGMENSEIEETVIIGPESETKSESESETESESEPEGQSENDGPDDEEDGDFNVKEESVNSSENEENSETNSEVESATEEGSDNGIETEKELDNAGETESKGDSGKDSEGNPGSDAGGGCMRTFSTIGMVFTAAVLHVV